MRPAYLMLAQEGNRSLRYAARLLLDHDGISVKRDLDGDVWIVSEFCHCIEITRYPAPGVGEAFCRKHPETLILTFDILIFCSAALLVKLTSGSLMKRSTDSSSFNRASCRLCANDFATQASPAFEEFRAIPCRLASEWSYTFFGTSGIRPRSAPRSRSG